MVTAADGGVQISASSTVELTADQILYAHWTQNPVVEPEKTDAQKVALVKKAVESEFVKQMAVTVFHRMLSKDCRCSGCFYRCYRCDCYGW